MAAAASKRLLFSRFRGGRPQNRPPWSIPEPSFSDACGLCGLCMRACPQKLLVAGVAGYPIAGFEFGPCTFCGACVEACKSGCFTADRGARPWRIAASAGPACIEAKGVTCRLCQDVCQPKAIRFRPKLGGGSAILIDPAACTGCGACVAPCPAGAITVAGSLPAEARG